MDAFHAYAKTQSVDLHVGRRTHRLLREAGVNEIELATTVIEPDRRSEPPRVEL